MERDDQDGDEGPAAPLLPPDDRLWRHPSEVGAHGPAGGSGVALAGPVGPKPWVVATVAASVGALFAVGLMATTDLVIRTRTTVLTTRPPVLPAVTASVVQAPAGVTDLAGQLMPAVVQVRAESPAGTVRGSGLVLREDGHLLTVHQAVAGASAVAVVLSDGSEVAGRLVASDAESNLAVLKIDTAGIVPAALASGAVDVGDAVTAVGCTGTPGALSMAGGRVRGVDGQLVQGSSPPLLQLIETDAADTGTMGGPLVDARGQVAGIIVGRLQDEGGAGRTVATPIRYALSVADQLIAVGRVVRPWIGVEGADLEAATAQELGVPGGAVVRVVKDGGPAAGAGLAPGDVIVAVDGERVITMAGLKIRLRTHRPGDVVRLTVLRASGRTEVDVALTERPA